MDKKGVSLIISWVLLIGFAVTLGVLVSTWMQDQAEETSETLLDDKTMELHCGDMAVNAFFPTPTCDTISTTNKGVFTIHQVHVRSLFGTETIEASIPPQQAQDLNIQTVVVSGESVEVIPVIKVEGKTVVCVNRKLSITC
jgi:hypothetical protein